MGARVWPLLSGLGLGLGLGLMACGAGQDDWPAGRPKIDQLEYLQQSSLDPWALQFLIVFVDTNSDLAAGTMYMSLNGNEASTRPLSEVFSAQTPALASDSSEGELEILVKISANVAIGDEVEVGFLLEDGAGQLSNEPSITVKAFTPGGGG